MKKQTASLWRCVRGMAIPLTFLLLFVSLTLAVTAAYYFAVTKVMSKTTLLKASQAKQAMLLLENDISSVAWLPGSSKICYLDDYGGEFRVETATQKLTLNLTDNTTFSEILFNSFVGKLVYELASSEPSGCYFLKGDERLIVNQSASTLAQIYIRVGRESQEITLCYRPFVSSSVTGSEHGKPENFIRIYIISLNSSQKLELPGNFKLKITCLNVTSKVYTYKFTYSIASLDIKANVDSTQTKISLPLSSTPEGAFVHVEVLLCHICLQQILEV